MLHNITQQGAINIKGAQGKIFRKFPKNLPIKNSCTLTETNVPRVSINEVGTVSFNNTELFNLLNKNNTQVRITLDIFYRAPETSQELNKETSIHLKRLYLFSTIINKRLSIDCDGVNIILYIDGSTPKIKTETMNYYKIDIENLTIYKNNDVIFAKYDMYNCIDTPITWKRDTSTYPEFFNHCYYANGIWVACNSCGNGLYYSIDGTTWAKSNYISTSFNHCYYANGIWVACSRDDTGLSYSIDGKIWEKCLINSRPFSFGTFTHCYYANEIWVACCDIGLYYSIDGINWEKGNISIGLNYCYYANGTWIACSYNTKTESNQTLFCSTNGKSWYNVATYNKGFIYCYYSNNIWIACSYSDGLYYSTNGENWSQSNINSGIFYYCYYANGVWVACSYNNGLYYSTNGENWSQSSINSGTFNCCYYANGVWVACSNKGLYYSIDGINWTKSNNTDSKFYNCYYANGVWVACNIDCYGLYYSQVNQNIVGQCKWGLYSNMPEVSPGSPGNSGSILV